MVHLFSYLANFIWNLSGTLEEETPYPSSKFAKSLRGKLIALGTFILRPVLMQHTVPQRPNVDLGKIWLHRSKPEKIQQHLLFTVFLLRGSICSFWTPSNWQPMKTQKVLLQKMGIFNPRSTSVQSSPCHSREKIPLKMSWQTTLRWTNSGKRGGALGWCAWWMCRKCHWFTTFQASKKLAWPIFVASKVGNPKKSAFSGILAF